MTDGEWPVALNGVIESVISTRGPDGRWNVAALGLHAEDTHHPTEPVRARTWGRTRTRRNFDRRGRGHVQFLRDPVVFVRAALDTFENDEPILDAAAASVTVEVTRTDSGTTGGTEWVDWTLRPQESTVVQRTVPRPTRSFGAVIELTVSASRLGVPEYDDEQLRERMTYFADVARRCGGPREREAVERVASLTRWGSDESQPETDGAESSAAHSDSTREE